MSRASSPLSDRVIFVVGARRSGTNWLQRVVCARPDVVAVPGETYLFSHGIQPLIERFQHGTPTSPKTGFVYMERAALLDAVRDLCDAVFLGLRRALTPNAERIVERTPDHVHHLQLMGEIYPDARFVHIIRDGRDVARSLLSQEWGPSTVEEAADEWRSAIEAARAAMPSLAHYREVRYEEILGDPRRHVVGLLDWLGLVSDAPAVDAALAEGGVRYNVDPAAPAAVAGKWKESFTPRDVEVFMRVAGETLMELGYTPDEPSAAGGSPQRGRQAASRSVARSRSSSRFRRFRRPGGFEKAALAKAEDALLVVDAVMGCMAERRFNDLPGLLWPKALVRIVDPEGDWQGRGQSAHGRLIQTLSTDPAIGGRQIRGDIHRSLPSFLVVAAYETGDSSVQERVFVITVQGARVGALTVYRFPLVSG